MIHLFGTKLHQAVPYQIHISLFFCSSIHRWKIMSTHLVPHLQNQWWSWWWNKSKRHQRSSNPHNWWRDNCQCWGKWPNLQEPTLPLQYWLQCPWKPLDHLLPPLHHQKLIHLCIPRFCHLEKKKRIPWNTIFGENLKKKTIYLAFLHLLEAWWLIWLSFVSASSWMSFSNVWKIVKFMYFCSIKNSKIKRGICLLIT